MSKEMIELSKKERALLVTVDIFTMRAKGITPRDEADELKELVKTSGLEIADEALCHYDKPSPNLFIGKGKAGELGVKAQEAKVDTVIFSVDLSGTQQRNLEDELGRKVIDRTQLILDIFAQHAKSPEGKMQVELAQLEYLLPRLSGKGIMLSRLGGGIGTRGPGEQKLELDRRRIRMRIDKLKRVLEKTRSQRFVIRKKRIEEKIPLISLVGYTNAGKTTLLNSLVNEHQLADDSLFTTLDPLSRTMVLPNNQKIVISDTVGFLHNLPVHLIEAFKATLEDMREADLLIHVLDISHPLRYSYFESVKEVLEELDCATKPVICTLNKIDKLQDLSWLERYKQDFPDSVAISALKKENLLELIAGVSAKVSAEYKKVEMVFPIDKMGLVEKIYNEGKVEEIKYLNKSIVVKAVLPRITISRLKGYKKIEEIS
jgi:GTP-binding protein HflX